ncbi:hypothetical protein ACMGDF_05365 [Morganella morganii]|uniref:hypothetical protein n=1 Tax=Morganella morganii TaxID=582 RepID=UPI003EBE476D
MSKHKLIAALFAVQALYSEELAALATTHKITVKQQLKQDCLFSGYNRVTALLASLL